MNKMSVKFTICIPISILFSHRTMCNRWVFLQRIRLNRINQHAGHFEVMLNFHTHAAKSGFTRCCVACAN